MAVEITHVHFGSTPRSEETITSYRWVNISNGTTGDSDKASMVRYIDVSKGSVYVGKGSARVSVGVVSPTYGTPYLRTYADGKWTNNLVNLPTF